MKNPLLEEFKTPFGIPPFEDIKEEHFLPAFKTAVEIHKKEIEKIINNPEEPTFKNTIEALEKSDEVLNRVYYTFYALLDSLYTEKMREISKEILPALTNHYDEIFMNEKLFEKVKAVYKKRKYLKLNLEQKRLLDKYYREFLKRGVNLDKKSKIRLMEINKELTLLSQKFGENVNGDEEKSKLIIEGKEDLEGLPESLIQYAENLAKERGYKNKWIFPLKMNVVLQFLQYSAKRELREKMLKAFMNIGNNNNEFDNKEIISKIIKLRIEKAKILGYKTFAHFVLDLEGRMLKKPKDVYNFLKVLWDKSIKKSKDELKEIQEAVYKEGKKFKIKPWDWLYYAEKVRKEKFNFEEKEIKPYLKLENCLDGMFYLANKLYGIEFVERNDLPKFHEDLKVYEVKDRDGSTLGVFYLDLFERKDKISHAWSTSFQKRSSLDGKVKLPIVLNASNFLKSTSKEPTLLTLDDLETLFHEFGHALHNLLSKCKYPFLSGTNVALDFVELPSMFTQWFHLEEDLLEKFAKHYKTNKPIPFEIIERVKNYKKFNQGFEKAYAIADALLDIEIHTLKNYKDLNPPEFEKKVMKKIGLIPEMFLRYNLTRFRHIFFTWKYEVGYYSYFWSEVLACDAFEYFKKNGLLNRKLGLSFRKNILEKGDSEDPMILYKRFRGRKPNVNAFLRLNGLI
jgi:peptidyl-dipeptidase Dcp